MLDSGGSAYPAGSSGYPLPGGDVGLASKRRWLPVAAVLRSR